MQIPGFLNKNFLKKLPLGLIVLIGLFVGSLYLLGSIINEIFIEQEEEFDEAIFDHIDQHLRNDNLTRLMKNVTYLAAAGVLQIAYGLLILIYIVRKNWNRCFEIMAIGFGGYLMNYLLKLLFKRVRPDNPLIEGHNNFAFPSGHASSAFIFYGLIAYLIFKSSIPAVYKYLFGTVSFLLAFLVGFSRLYLRVHYPTDVLAGFCIGFAWLLSCIWLFEFLKMRRRLSKK